MPVPQAPDSEITIQSVIFDQDSVSITYAETADVRVHLDDQGAHAIVLTHVVTFDRKADVHYQLQQLEEAAQDALVASMRWYEQLPNLADAASTASSGGSDDERDDERDNDEFRGLGD